MDRYDPYTDKFLRDTQYNIHGTNLAEVGTDCISREQAIDALKQQADTMSRWSERYAEHRKGVLTAVNIVEDLPPIQLEIVRCEECKYHYQRNCPIEKYFSLDGFCSRGKRREVSK